MDIAKGDQTKVGYYVGLIVCPLVFLFHVLLVNLERTYWNMFRNRSFILLKVRLC